MNSVIEAHQTYLENYPWMINPYFRIINNKYPSFSLGASISFGGINEQANKREDDFNACRNRHFQTNLLDQQRVTKI